MRVNSNMVPNILADLQQSQSTLNTALQEVSTGKSVTIPSDNPAASAEMVANTLETANVDQYTKNINNVLANVQSASSALSSVTTALTQAVSLGTEGANGTNTSANLATLAQQVQSILSNVVSDANTSVGGTYLFGGTSSTTAPYTADSSSASGYAYNGTNDSNSVAVGDNLNVQVNLPGSQVFSNSSNNVLGAQLACVCAPERQFIADLHRYLGGQLGHQLRQPGARLLQQCGKPVELAGDLPAAGHRNADHAAEQSGGSGRGPGRHSVEPG